ncbi:MAG: MBL fold metallo-hydrolase [Anaerolineae bacterium]|nr:MBL fold metallo-hydrolase [Anaerolineae bacterium]
MIDNIQWLGHGSFFIQGPPLIYINPWRVARSIFHADVILVGHHHAEHYSPADINKLRGTETRIITNEQVAKEIDHCTILRPWQSVQIDRAGIKAIPAYSPKGWQHPQSDGGLGFLISLNYYDIYYAGDTDITEEMGRIRPDIAILPIDGNGTLNVLNAAEVVKQMRPRWVIPCNWGPGDENNVRLFQQEVGGRAEVIIPTLVP